MLLKPLKLLNLWAFGKFSDSFDTKWNSHEMENGTFFKVGYNYIWICAAKWWSSHCNITICIRCTSAHNRAWCGAAETKCISWWIQACKPPIIAAHSTHRRAISGNCAGTSANFSRVDTCSERGTSIYVSIGRSFWNVNIFITWDDWYKLKFPFHLPLSHSWNVLNEAHKAPE